MTDKPNFLGLPTRREVQDQLHLWVPDTFVRSIHWIRVAEQLRGRAPDARIYALASSKVALDLSEHRDLREMIAARQWQIHVVTPPDLARMIADGMPL